MTRQFSLRTLPKQLYSQPHAFLLSFTLLILLAVFFGYLVTIPAWAKATAVEVIAWQETTSLPVALAGRNTVVHGDRLYVVGGKKADNSASREIYSATIDGTGEIDAWNSVGTLPRDYYLFTAVVANDALFLIGGWNGSATVSDVWRGEFLSDGRVDNWRSMPALPVAVDLHDSLFIDGHIYSVGGWNGTEPQQGVYAAAVTTTGLNGWQQVGTLPNALYRHAVAGAQGHLYVTGGYDAADNAQATVLAAKVNGTAPLGSWQLPPALPMLTYYHNVVIHDGRLVILGGRNDSTVFNSVYSALIGADGLPGTWRLEQGMPQSLFRFGTAVVARNGSDYLFVTGGLRSDTDYQSAAYHSNIPLPPTATPTPTFTPSPTPTPTPTGVLTVALANSPSSWVSPGGKVTYTIRYRNDGEHPVNNVEVANAIPAGVALVADSIRSSAGTFSVVGTQSGAAINWQIGEVAPDGEGEVAYTVQRPLPPTPAIPLALDITVDAPAEATINEPITYRFVVTNRAPIALNNVTVTNVMPAGATYLSGGDGAPTNGIVRWTIGRLAPESVTELSYQVRAQSSLVNYDYQVQSQEGASTRGRTLVVTRINGQPPRVGDGFVIVNQGATVLWSGEVGGQSKLTNAAYNPSFELYLPAVQRGD